ncbi:hypothetical protein [Actinomadura rugatobispora]|uniref:Uncharacterized protein n=1 Tax=Actinomadura rugatobispora TaxID=1994 RepID=A0ABW1AIE1_9ACTN
MTITDPIPVIAEPSAAPGPPMDLVTAPPPDPAAVVVGPPPPVEVVRETLPPVPVPVPVPVPMPEAVPAPRPPAPVEVIPEAPPEPPQARTEAPPEPPQARTEAPPAPVVAPAAPSAPATVVDQVISTGPQPSVAVQDLPVWDAPDSHWTPSPAPAATAQPAPPPPAPPAAPAPPRPPAPGAARRRSKAGLIALLAVGAGVAAAAVTAVLVAVSGGDDVPLRKVAAGSTAGGLRKDAAVPATSAAYPFIIAAARSGGVEQAATAGGVYRDPATGAQNILFLGGTAPIGDPAAFLKKARPSTALKVAPTVPGKGKAGGQVSCGTFAVLAETHLYCAWATENSFGFVASNEPAGAVQPSALAPLTLRMRTDLEKRSP